MVSPMEKGRAERQAKPGTRVITPAELGLRGRQRGRMERQVEALLKTEGIKRIEVPADFPVGLYRALAAKGIAIRVLSRPVCPQRSIKTPAETALLRASQRAAVAAMRGAVARIASARIDAQGLLRSGRALLSSECVRRQIHEILMQHECIGSETIVAGGRQAADPHERGSGPLRAGEAIIIDIFPKSEKSGYWGDITRTVCRGPAAPELKRLYQAVRAAQSAALRCVSAGVCSDEVHAAAQSVFVSRGYETGIREGHNVGFIHGTGHGVGLDIHESPRISAGGGILQAGQVITIEPGLYYPDLGGVRIEDTIIVTEEGWRYLAACEKKFEV